LTIAVRRWLLFNTSPDQSTESTNQQKKANHASAHERQNPPRHLQRRRQGWLRGAKLNRILESIKPEAAYFTEHDGHRGAVLVVDMADPSKIPSLAEPWFLTFQADVSFRIAMTLDDLKRSSLDEMAQKWG
jgi:hypothetical protein